MNESVQNLVNAIAAGSALDTENAFAAAMAEKLAPMIDARRVEVAQSMFASQQEQEVVSEEMTKENDSEEDDNDDEDKEDKEDKQEMKEGAYTNPGLEALLAKKRAEKTAAATNKKIGK